MFFSSKDHYLSAEMMGINLSKCKFYPLNFFLFCWLGGALYSHYLSFVFVEEFNIQLSIFFAMIIIGGLGSIRI